MLTLIVNFLIYEDLARDFPELLVSLLRKSNKVEKGVTKLSYLSKR